MFDSVIYDKDSPTGLSWARDIFSGRNMHIICARKGAIAGGPSGEYFEIGINGKSYWCHKVVWEICNGEIPKGFKVDHIDGNGKNNSISNLRVVTHKVNMHNQKKRSTNTSGVTGVDATPCGWRARWQDTQGKTKSKTLATFDEAVLYRDKMLESLNSSGAEYTERHGK